MLFYTHITYCGIIMCISSFGDLLCWQWASFELLHWKVPSPLCFSGLLAVNEPHHDCHHAFFSPRWIRSGWAQWSGQLTPQKPWIQVRFHWNIGWRKHIRPGLGWQGLRLRLGQRSTTTHWNSKFQSLAFSSPVIMTIMSKIGLWLASKILVSKSLDFPGYVDGRRGASPSNLWLHPCVRWDEHGRYSEVRWTLPGIVLRNQTYTIITYGYF